ncbi:hypothetical protein E1J38_008070 [Seonamhaeicola sediminis]|uniref:Thioredoxin domain-containing protein n=1 Tax=Seonamhaeicola sediminis TaxID=2528206 RepID=A0A562YEV8_9FLAO|nr:hypothetical protein [Seonamhaeicola sediminis]TWO32812.1 hypothetical protein E1J38_008070 [Seonamhaeicola sediminis]
MKIYVSILLSSLMFFWSCEKNSSSTENNIAYFGGEIINPTTKFLVLEKGEHKTDTIRLDGRNRFLYKIDSLKEGIYTFKHGGEYQSILLEPNDSVLLRLNTLEFDESLVYTGKGAKKNNYFINEFLENEKEEKYILKLCQLEPLEYLKRVDSLKQRRLDNLERFTKKYDVSDLFHKIALANIGFNYNASKEMYPFMHYGNNKGDFLIKLPDDFYSYRETINYNDTFFKHYHNYHKFLRSNFNNISLEAHYKHKGDERFKWSSACFNLDRLHLIDSLVTDESIKDELLYYFTIKYISLSNNPKGNSLILASFSEKTNNEFSKNSMEHYVRALQKLEPGSKLPSIPILDYNNNEYEINSVINKPTIITFWSNGMYSHFKDNYLKIKELTVKYPEVNFITINVDDIGLEKPKQILKDCKFNCDNQYLFKNPEESKKALVIYPVTKTFIINENKEIVRSNANIFSMSFEEQLLGLINN